MSFTWNNWDGSQKKDRFGIVKVQQAHQMKKVFQKDLNREIAEQAQKKSGQPDRVLKTYIGVFFMWTVAYLNLFGNPFNK